MRAPVNVGRDEASWLIKSSLLPELALRLEKLIKQRWKRYRKQLKQVQQHFTETAIHDSRVETRRLISAVVLLQGFWPEDRRRKMENFLKAHLDSLNDLRDTQVQLSVTRRLRRQFVAAKLFHQFLQLCERRLAREARKDLKRLKTQRLEKLVSAGRKELRQKLRKLSVAKIRRLLLEPMLRAYDRTWRLHQQVRASNPATIHRTRVAFKRFRYMVETLIACGKIAPASLVDPLRAYQGRMGVVQDAEMLLQAFQHFVDQDSPPAPDAARFKRELIRKRQVAIRKYMRVRPELEKFRPRLRSSGAPV